MDDFPGARGIMSPAGLAVEAPSRDQAWKHLFTEETMKRVERWLRRLRVPARERRDLIQTVLLAAVESFPSYDPSRGSPVRWLNGIAVNVAGHHAGKAYRWREVLMDPEDLGVADERPSAAALLLAEERYALMRALVLELPVELRSVLVLHDVDEVEMKVVAERQGIPLSTAYKRRRRAAEGVREALARRVAVEKAGRWPRHRAGGRRALGRGVAG
ncbi:RNA polymerase sigma factor [Sorangium sp. So ce1389]|uniref:RNA polymerase sigma factor n=1 Tax=Sorangium sp. So ce1389 TaxID=3133336 RepID=UPI003F62028E